MRNSSTQRARGALLLASRARGVNRALTRADQPVRSPPVNRPACYCGHAVKRHVRDTPHQCLVRVCFCSHLGFPRDLKRSLARRPLPTGAPDGTDPVEEPYRDFYGPISERVAKPPNEATGRLSSPWIGREQDPQAWSQAQNPRSPMNGKILTGAHLKGFGRLAGRMGAPARKPHGPELAGAPSTPLRYRAAL